MIEGNLDEDPVEEVLEATDAPPKVLLEPMLLTAPAEDVLLVVDDTRVPIEDTPAALPELLELKEGSGDLDREPEDEVEVEVEVPFPILLGIASLPSSSTFASGLLLAFRIEQILLPLATAVVEWAGAIDDFFLGARGGGPILAFDATGFAFVSIGLGILLAIAGAGAFPRFHTL